MALLDNVIVKKLQHVLLVVQSGLAERFGKRTPSLTIEGGARCYFNSAENAIHLGKEAPQAYWGISDEEGQIAGLQFLHGHEMGHMLHTSKLSWEAAVNGGTYALIQYIQQKLEGRPKHFRNDAAYKDWVTQVLPTHGIFCPYDYIEKVAHSVTNVIEDGRIERIRALRAPGFAAQRKFFRGREWDRSEATAPDSAKEEFELVFSQVGKLATTQMFQKKFLKVSSDEEQKAVLAMMPFIRNGVRAPQCRGIARPVMEVCRLLAPYFWAMFEPMDADPQPGPGTPGTGGDPQDPGNGNPGTQQGDGGTGAPGGDPGEMIDGTQPGSGPGNTPGGDPGNVPGDEPGGDPGLIDGPFKFDPVKDAIDSIDKSLVSDDSNLFDLSELDEDVLLDGEDEGFDDAPLGVSDLGGKFEATETGSRGPGGKSSSTIDEIIDALRAAGEQCRSDAGDILQTINTAAAHESHTGVDEVMDEEKPLTGEDLGVKFNFKELKRSYKLDQSLPPLVAARAKVLRRKTKRFFQSLKSPTRRYLDSGSVDPGLISGLAMGETDVFRRKGKDKVFDGVIEIIIDGSGSMGGDKYREALIAAAVQEEAYKGLVPCKIVVFRDGVVHEVVKNFSETKKKSCSWNHFVHSYPGGGTPTSEAVTVATKELVRRPEAKKLLVVLTDGEPNNIDATQKAIETARKSGVMVSGIYFEEGKIGQESMKTFEKIFKKDYVACELSEVDRQLEKVLRTFTRS